MFFDNCKNTSDTKQRYRLLSKRFHPDLGGTDDLMKELIEEYEKKVYEFDNPIPKYEAPKKPKKSKSQINYEEKIEAILNWASKNESFDTEFIESLSEQITFKDLSYAQEKAIDNIIKRFRIPI